MRLLLLLWGFGAVVFVISTISKTMAGDPPKNLIKTLSAVLIWPLLALSKSGRQVLFKDLNKQ